MYAIELLINNKWNEACLSFDSVWTARAKMVDWAHRFNAENAIVISRMTGEVVAELGGC